MKTKRTIELTVETSSVSVLRRLVSSSVPAWCDVCARPEALVTLEVAAHRTGLSVRAICQKVEAGEIHFLETPAGSLLICLESFT